jgi:hypothetical protein
MSKLLYSQSTQVIKPYPRLDDASIAGLDPDYLVLDKVEVAPISYDPATQSLSSTYVVDTDTLEYRQEWTVTDLPPVPDWDSFNTYMLSDPMFKTYRDTVRSIDGELTGALFDAYAMIDAHGINAFSSIWGVWVSVSGISEVDRGIIANTAHSYNLPEAFVDIISV